MQTPRPIKFLTALFITALATACIVKGESVEQDANKLQDYVQLSAPIAASKFEIVTLPEHGSDDIPGPTDYVSLIASVQAEGTDLRSALKPSSDDGGIQPSFSRRWLTASEKRAVSEYTAGRLRAYDLMPFVRRPANRAVLLHVDANSAVVYIEFVSPISPGALD